MDYLTVEETLKGYKYLLVIVDHFTKLAVAESPEPGHQQEDVAVAIDYWRLCVTLRQVGYVA